jgi:hypothetical protein
MKGKLGRAPIAVKTVKKTADIGYLKALLSELKIMCYVGKHDNIVNLIGGCTQNIHKRKILTYYYKFPQCRVPGTGFLSSYHTECIK